MFQQHVLYWQFRLILLIVAFLLQATFPSNAQAEKNQTAAHSQRASTELTITAIKTETNPITRTRYVCSLQSALKLPDKELPLFISILSSPHASFDAKNCAVSVITQYGARGKEATAALTRELLSNNSLIMQSGIIKALGSIGLGASAAVPALASFLQAPGTKANRSSILYVLISIAPKNDAYAIQALVFALHNQDTALQKMALELLLKHRTTSPEIQKALQSMRLTYFHPNAYLFLKTAKTLFPQTKWTVISKKQIEDEAADLQAQAVQHDEDRLDQEETLQNAEFDYTIPSNTGTQLKTDQELLDELNKAVPNVYLIIEEMIKRPEINIKFVRKLEQLIKSEQSASYSYYAVKNLFYILTKVESNSRHEVVRFLVDQLNNDNFIHGRHYVAVALGKIASPTEEVITALSKMVIHFTKSGDRVVATKVLGQLANKKDRTANKALIVSLNDKNPFIQATALRALLAQHNDTPEILDALKALKLSQNSHNTELYKNVIATLFPDVDIQFTLVQSKENILFDDLFSENTGIRRNAYKTLDKTLEISGALAAQLAQHMNSSAVDFEHLIDLCAALHRTIPSERPLALKDIFAWFKHATSKNNIVHEACLEALAINAHDNKEVIAYLREGLLRGSYSTSGQSIESRRYGKNFGYTLAKMAEAGIAPLMEGLRSHNPATVSDAARAIKYAKGNLSPAIPLLLELVGDTSKHIVQCDFIPADTTMGNPYPFDKNICYNSTNVFIDAIRHIAPDSPELEQAISMQESLYPDKKDENKHVPME